MWCRNGLSYNVGTVLMVMASRWLGGILRFMGSHRVGAGAEVRTAGFMVGRCRLLLGAAPIAVFASCIVATIRGAALVLREGARSVVWALLLLLPVVGAAARWRAHGWVVVVVL